MSNDIDFSDNVFNNPDLPNSVNQNQQIPQQIPDPQPIYTGGKQVTEEMLDAMINNPNEHEQVKAQARELKEKLYGNKGLELPQMESTQQPQTQVQPQFQTQIQPEPPAPQPNLVLPPEQGIRQASNEDISNLLGSLKSNLYTSEVNLLSDPSSSVQLRAMTVQEYKFLSKQLEIFENTVRGMNKEDDNVKWKFDLCEMRLTNSLDTVLKNCVSNIKDTSTLSFFDWVYLLMVLKQISRGSTTSWEVKCSNKDCKKNLPVQTNDIIQSMQSLNQDIYKMPFGTVEFNGIKLLLSVINRGDMEYMEKFIAKNKDYNLDTCTIACSIKEYESNGVKSKMNCSQRFQVFDSLNIGVMEEIVHKTKDHMKAFTETLGMVTCDKCGEEVKINVSDFFLSFFVL
jgi:hypothetical protein